MLFAFTEQKNEHSRASFWAAARIFGRGWVSVGVDTFRILLRFRFALFYFLVSFTQRRYCMRLWNASVPHQNYRVDLGACCTTGKAKLTDRFLLSDSAYSRIFIWSLVPCIAFVACFFVFGETPPDIFLQGFSSRTVSSELHNCGLSIQVLAYEYCTDIVSQTTQTWLSKIDKFYLCCKFHRFH